jgi:methyltransferase
MVSSQTLYTALIGAVYAERLLELVVSERNARRLLAAGGVEAGRRHYPAMVAFHALFPAACAAEVLWFRWAFPVPLGWIALALVLAAQGLRWWCVAALGGRWTVRVIAVPEAPPVTGGPYRRLRHPNYLAVLVEVAALPLVHGAWLAAIVASAVDAVLLGVRVRCEERALGAAWQAAFARRPRFFPAVRRV